MNCSDTKLMVWVGLEPMTYSTTQARKRRSSQMSHELTLNNKGLYFETFLYSFIKLNLHGFIKHNFWYWTASFMSWTCIEPSPCSSLSITVYLFLWERRCNGFFKLVFCLHFNECRSKIILSYFTWFYFVLFKTPSFKSSEYEVWWVLYGIARLNKAD